MASALRLFWVMFGLPAMSGAALAASGSGEAPRERHSPLTEIHAKPLAAFGNEAIRFSSAPALGGTSTVVEVRPDRNQSYKVTVSYLEGHPSQGWDKFGNFHFWINKDDFNWLLGKVEAAEREIGASDGGPDANGDILVCSDGPGYISEIRSRGQSRWISGFCGRNANNTIAPLMARLVRYGTAIFLNRLDRHETFKLRGEQDKTRPDE